MSTRLKTITNSLGTKFVLLLPGRYSAGNPPHERYRHRDETPHAVTFKKGH